MKIQLLVPVEIELADLNHCDGCPRLSQEEIGGSLITYLSSCGIYPKEELISGKRGMIIRPDACKITAHLAELHEKQKAILAEMEAHIEHWWDKVKDKEGG